MDRGRSWETVDDYLELRSSECYPGAITGDTNGNIHVVGGMSGFFLPACWSMPERSALSREIYRNFVRVPGVRLLEKKKIGDRFLATAPIYCL